MTTQTARIIDSISVSLNAGGMNTINIVLAFVMFGVPFIIFGALGKRAIPPQNAEIQHSRTQLKIISV